MAKNEKTKLYFFNINIFETFLVFFYIEYPKQETNPQNWFTPEQCLKNVWLNKVLMNAVQVTVSTMKAAGNSGKIKT